MTEGFFRIVILWRAASFAGIGQEPGADPGGRWVRRPPLGRRDPRRRRGFLRLKGRKKGHWCPLNGCSTLFKHNMAINILKSKSVCVCQKSLIPISYKVINPLAPSPGGNPGSAPGNGGHGDHGPLTFQPKLFLKSFLSFLKTIFIRKTIHQDEESTNLRRNPS